MTTLRKLASTPLLEIFLIVVIAGATYLPHLSQATIYRDDWYYTMDRMIGGPGVFHEMFSIDRPARGPLFEAYYQLFGIQPFPYHMMSFVWRVAGGLAALWLFRPLWPRQRLATFLMALLFVLDPGYVRWMEGFEDQPRMLSSFLETLSIALTLKAITTTRTIPKVLAWTISILSGWAYLTLVDFAFGMEVFRLLCVFLLMSSDQQALPFVKRSLLALRAWGVAVLVPAGFLFWRLFLFHNERQATDIGLQLSSLTAAPLTTGLQWLLRLVQSASNVLIPEWGVSPFQDLFQISLPKAMLGAAVAGGAALLVLVASFLMQKVEEAEPQNPTRASHGTWQLDAIWVGLASVFAGVLPVIIANRYISVEAYSHYALPASLAGVIVVVGVLSLIHSRVVRFGSAAVLILLAILTQYSVGWRVLHEEQVIADFWQQVVWRAPGIKAGTTLFVNYPSVDYGEDVDAVNGPANFIYFPQQTNQIPAVYQLDALPQMQYTTVYVLRGINRASAYRTHVGVLNSDKMLVISQPTQSSCVHVLDSQWPRYSNQESDQVLLLGEYSKVESVLVEAETPHLAESIFGPQPAPAQTWCFFYEKAELALQKGDWETVVQIGKKLTQLDLSPEDKIEWMPFLQAYALNDDEQAFTVIAAKIEKTPFVRQEACRTLLKMHDTGSTFTPQIRSLIEQQVCRTENGD